MAPLQTRQRQRTERSLREGQCHGCREARQEEENVTELHAKPIDSGRRNGNPVTGGQPPDDSNLPERAAITERQLSGRWKLHIRNAINFVGERTGQAAVPGLLQMNAVRSQARDP